MISLWIAFGVGQAVQSLRRAHLVVRSPKSDLLTMRAWVYRNWPGLVVRGFISSLAFAVWVNEPALATKILARFGVILDFTVPVTRYTAAGFGFVIDFLLEWVLATRGWGERLPAVKEADNG